MGWFTDFVAEVTGTSTSEAARAGHEARTDMGAREGKDNFDKAPDWAEDNLESGISLFPDGKGPDGK